ncbi:hypothetical protein PIB30_030667 [Stylosanthes scabra]|uniref:RNase H type-1 domain-containing protein n=1 Tax=Stylosanthes scabra TaxID=79078 RepID=A0ABU6QBW1_9FABA|nr:hypothetical protein [Stylosanthes scabra]
MESEFTTTNTEEIAFTEQNARVRRVVTWHAPSPGWLKCNVDASYDCSMGQGAVAAIFRDHEGKIVAESSSKMQATSVLATEAFAMREALEGNQLANEVAKLTRAGELDPEWYANPTSTILRLVTSEQRTNQSRLHLSEGRRRITFGALPQTGNFCYLPHGFGRLVNWKKINYGGGDRGDDDGDATQRNGSCHNPKELRDLMVNHTHNPIGILSSLSNSCRGSHNYDLTATGTAVVVAADQYRLITATMATGGAVRYDELRRDEGFSQVPAATSAP